MNNGSERTRKATDAPADPASVEGETRPDKEATAFRGARAGAALFPTTGAVPPASTAAPIELWSMLGLLLRRWPWLVWGAGGLMALGALAASSVWRADYTATAQLFRHEPPALPDFLRPRQVATPTLLSVIQAPELLRQVGAQLNPLLSMGQVAGRIHLTPERDGDVVTVKASGPDLKTTIDLANAFCRAAIQATRNLQISETAEAAAFVDRQLADVEGDIGELRRQWPGLARALPAALLPPDRLNEKIEAAREELANLLTRYTEAHPLVRQQRARLQTLLDPLPRASAPAKTPPIGSDASSTPAAGRPVEYESLQKRLATLENDRAQLVARQRALQMFEANPPGLFSLLAPAELGQARREHHRLKIGLFTVFCGLLGLVGAAGAALLRELTDRRLKTGADVWRVTRLPLLATLGNLGRLSPTGLETWAFRTWTALQNRLSPSPNHGLVCGITSADSGDGRSTWIRLLAQAASQCGFRVLTIATRPTSRPIPAGNGETPDNATPVASAAAPVESAALTANVLASPAEVAERLLDPASQPMVHIPLPGWTWNLERRKQWQMALNSWRQIDNLVILVELPPASVSEAVLLAENLPNLLWLAHSGKSDARDTREQLATLRHARCNLVGAVLNREPEFPLKGRLARWAAWTGLFATLALNPSNGFAADSSADQPGPASFSVVSPVQRAAWQERLILGPGDRLNLALFGEPELARENVPVGPDGRISYLEAHNVQAASLTVDEFRASLNEELARYRRAPEVIVVPTEFHSKKYFVLGRVARQGVFTLDRPITVIEAVARSGGLETGLAGRNLVELADLSRSFLAREGRHMPVNFEKLFLEGDLAQNVPLEPGDYLYFPAGDLREVYVLGEVGLPGAMPFSADTSALAAIAARGGFTDRAWKGRVLVVRGSLNHPETFVVNAADVLAARAQDFRLQPRDIVFVSHRPWIKAEELLDEAGTAFVQSAVVTWTGLNAYPLLR